MNAHGSPGASSGNPISKAWRTVLSHIWLAVAISGVSSLLLLTPTLYLLGIYQRVVPAASVETLIGLTVVAVAAVTVVSVLDGLRIRVLAKASTRLNRMASEELVLASLNPSLPMIVRQDILKNFDMVRQVVTGPALLAVLDAPWVIVFVGAALLLHPVIGLVIAGFALVLVVVAFTAQRSVRSQSERANATIRQADANLRANVWRAGAIQSSGMRPSIARRRFEERIAADGQFLEAVAHLGDFNALSRLLRQIAQIVVLGVAGYLVVRHQAQPAIIFAASLLLGRTLAPFDQIAGSFRQVLQARQAVALLQTEVFKPQGAHRTTRLPRPSGDVQLEQLVLTAPGQRRPLLKASVQLHKGDFVVITGPSGAGKSTLLSAIAGGHPAAAGVVRHDGADIRDWAPDDFARGIGYSGPDPVLLGGTILENIARFDPAGFSTKEVQEAVFDSARRAGVHQIILAQPGGYATRLGMEGEGLSSGQAHRVALARALYGNPSLVLLDEPDAHLDALSRSHLAQALVDISAAGATVIVVSHEPEIVRAANRRFEILDGELKEMIAR